MTGPFSPQSYSEWLRGFEKKAKASVAGTSDAETVKVSLGDKQTVRRNSQTLFLVTLG